jgi:hypothetical protein
VATGVRRYSFLFTLICGSLLQGQGIVPHPYAFAGPKQMGGGYAPFALVGGGGVRIDSTHFQLDGNGWYDTGRKTNDNDQPNPKGRDRGLAGAAYYRLPAGWAFGAGARWNELSTTNYHKSAVHPTFGGSKDYFRSGCVGEGCWRPFSARIGVDYVMKGTDWKNGSQGTLCTLYVPSPSAKAHVFYRETMGVYRVYDTVTDRADHALTLQQMSNHSWQAFAEFTAMVRW